MNTIAHASRRIVLALVAGALLASLAAPGASAAGFNVRLEAGPHPAVTFSATWAITASKTITLTAPATVAGSRRASVPGRGVYLKIAGGALAGWWVKESRVSYFPGWVAATAYTPFRHVTLGVGSWELYRFDGAGAVTQGKGITVTTATTVHANRTAVVDGRSYVRI
ncbi:MAG TPA: hypothetical protein VHN80_04560, partial [Kineosporiaceae bacterium]|nr:hypothetical protein [Kineosporiaceae bacterium]